MKAFSWIAAMLLICGCIVGCATKNAVQNDSISRIQVSARIKSLHQGMERTNVLETLKPIKVFGGSSVSGFGTQFYLLTKETGVWLTFVLGDVLKVSDGDTLLSMPTTISIKSRSTWKNFPLSL